MCNQTIYIVSPYTFFYFPTRFPLGGDFNIEMVDQSCRGREKDVMLWYSKVFGLLYSFLILQVPFQVFS